MLNYWDCCRTVLLLLYQKHKHTSGIVRLKVDLMLPRTCFPSGRSSISNINENDEKKSKIVFEKGHADMKEISDDLD